MFCLGLIGWAFNAFFYLSPLGLLPLSLGYSYYLLLRSSMGYVLFHLTVIGLKKFVPTLFLNLVRRRSPIDAFISFCLTIDSFISLRSDLWPT